MSKSAKAQEPSMEEILASIRRIIADEGNAVNQQAAKAPAPAPAPARSAAPPPQAAANPAARPAPPDVPAPRPAPAASDVLDLDQPVAPAPAGFTPVRGSDVMFREGERPQRPPAPAAPVPQPVPAPSSRGPLMADDDLLSPDATNAVSAAFGTLAHTILSENARTLEDLVKEMMRPMLKEWLDDNLPGLVERIVRAEIERVARGGR